MFNFIKVKENEWININHITLIEYYPKANFDQCYLIINTVENVFCYDLKDEALDMVEKLKQHGIFLE